jgi:hypothetical protein
MREVVTGHFIVKANDHPLALGRTADMANIFRDQPKVRRAVGAVFCVCVWSLYIVRSVFGVGPMHDPQGNQAPATNYLIGALIVTGMVAAWIVVSERFARKDPRD